MLDDLYASENEAIVNDMIARPPQAKPQDAKFSIWKTTTAAPRGVAAGAAESAGFVSDIVGAFGQVVGAHPEILGGPLDDTQRKQADEQRKKLNTQGIDYSSEGGDVFRGVAKSYMPDPTTAHTAEQTVFGLTRFGSKAVGYSLAAGPTAGAGLLGFDEAMTTSDALRLEGVDEATRTKVGAVAGVAAAAAPLLPVAGKTLAQTAALVGVGGPGAFMAQQAATRQILQDAGYDHLSTQYDPLDPVGLAVSTLVPAGFGAFALRGAKARAAKDVAADIKPDQAPKADAVLPEQASVLPERTRPTPEQVDAARVEMLTQHVESARLTPIEDVAGARAHNEAMSRAMEQLAAGERVQVADVAPVPRMAPTETPEFKAWFGGSKVTDEQGQPLVVYHGTNADVPAFDLGKAGAFGENFGRVAFFSSDPGVAGSYAARWMGSPDFVAAKASHDRALSEYAQAVLKHGKESPEAKAAKQEADSASAAAKRAAKAVEEMATPSEGANVVPAHLSLRNPLVVDAGGKNWSQVNEQAVRAAMDGGHDGLILRNVVDSANSTAAKSSTVYAVFDPKQIKSAIGNSGKFDPSSPSLTDSRFASWADQINAAIADMRAAAQESANVQDAPQARQAGRSGDMQPEAAAAKQTGTDAAGNQPATAGEQGGGGVSAAGSMPAEAGLVAQRLAEVSQQFPDLTVQMDGMDKPMALADFLAQVQREAMEGTEFDLGGNDAPLMQVAATCFLLNG